LWVAGDLGNLPRSQLGVNVFGQLLALLGQAVDFFGNVDGRIVLYETQLFNLGIQFRDRLLKIEEKSF